MAVARIILASIAIALVAAQNIDCANPTAPSANMNYFVPPSDCRASNANIEACYTQWGQCTGNGTNCAGITGCIKSFLVCVDNIPAPAMPNASSPCAAWNESFSNVKMYLEMGGAYTGSALQTACNYAVCTYATNAIKSSINNGTACPVPAEVCNAAPKPPPKFILTFAGNWATILTQKPDVIRGALQRGIAKLLEVAEYVIRVLSFKSGSLIVEFAVLDPSVDGNAVSTKLSNAVGNNAVLATAFAELAQESGITISLESVAAGEGSGVTVAPAGTTVAPGTQTPATQGPTTAAPGSNGASAASAVVAVALVAMSLLF